MRAKTTAETYFDPKIRKWVARIRRGICTRIIGYFDTKIHATAEGDKASRLVNAGWPPRAKRPRKPADKPSA